MHNVYLNKVSLNVKMNLIYLCSPLTEKLLANNMFPCQRAMRADSVIPFLPFQPYIRSSNAKQNRTNSHTFPFLANKQTQFVLGSLIINFFFFFSFIIFPSLFPSHYFSLMLSFYHGPRRQADHAQLRTSQEYLQTRLPFGHPSGEFKAWQTLQQPNIIFTPIYCFFPAVHPILICSHLKFNYQPPDSPFVATDLRFVTNGLICGHIQKDLPCCILGGQLHTKNAPTFLKNTYF